MEGGFGYEEKDGLGAAFELPPGFRFHPTDEEIVSHYLVKKVLNRRFVATAIGEADLNKCEPWDSPQKAKFGEKEWFFFCQKDRKYPTGMRTNRATQAGYWKATGKDKEIYKEKNKIIGMKKTLVFYKGRAPKGQKTNWVIHEYRLQPNLSSTSKDEWVVCKVFDKGLGFRKTEQDGGFMDHGLDTSILPPLSDYSGSVLRSGSNFDANGGEFEGNVSSSRFAVNYPQEMIPQTNYNRSTLSVLCEAVQNPMLRHQMAVPNSIFPRQQLSYAEPIQSHPTNLSFKGIGQNCKIEQFSSNNSVACHSQETGMSSEIASVHSMGATETNKIFDGGLEDLVFSPNASDLDSLWN